MNAKAMKVSLILTGGFALDGSSMSTLPWLTNQTRFGFFQSQMTFSLVAHWTYRS
jgi:hypothetical protein